MTVESPQLGRLEYEESDVIRFDQGLLGFPELRRFLHLDPEPAEPLGFLLPLEQPALAFPVVDPCRLRPEYSVEIGERDRRDLDLEPGDGLRVFCIASVGQSVASATLNLLAPVVVNPRARRGLQLVLEGSSYSIAEPVFAGD